VLIVDVKLFNVILVHLTFTVIACSKKAQKFHQGS